MKHVARTFRFGIKRLPDQIFNRRVPGSIMQKFHYQESELMTEGELIAYLRIPEVSKSKDYHNVIENLKRMHQLPRIHICGKPLYPRGAIKEWVKVKTIKGK